MAHVQHDKEKTTNADAWKDVQVAPLAVPGPIMHNDHAYQLFIAERQARLAGEAVPASERSPRA